MPPMLPPTAIAIGVVTDFGNTEAAISGVAPISSATDVPVTVMQALYGRNVTLVIRRGGEEYTVFGRTMQKPEAGRIYYTFAQMETMYGKKASNPETGGGVISAGGALTPLPVVTETVPESPAAQPVETPAPEPAPKAVEPAAPAVVVPAQEPSTVLQHTSSRVVIAVAAAVVVLCVVGLVVFRKRT